MYRKMRRKDRQVDDKESIALLKKVEFGVLSCLDKDQAYGVPLSYVYKDNKIYFHSALKGQKIDILKENSKVCFTVVGENKAVYDDDYTAYFESVIIFGEAKNIENDEEKIEALKILCEKYLIDDMDKFDNNINRYLNNTAVYEIEIKHMTGKKHNENI